VSESQPNFEAWLLTEEAKGCLEGTVTGQYLKNRLWWAYMAGWNARDKAHDP
jgi:hypothetical protein